MHRRVIKSLVLGSVAALFVAVGSVSGKVPYFSIDVTPAEPRVGDTVIVVVRMWDDARHTVPATWWPEPTVEGLLEARGPAGRVPITLSRVDAATYRAEITLSEGTWRLVPFPRAGGGTVVGAAAEGYPAPMTVTVTSPASAVSTPLLAAGIAFVAVAVVAAWRLSPARRLAGAARSPSAGS